MGKLLLILSMIGILYLGIGTATRPDDFMFWLASGELLNQQVRGVIFFTLLLQVFTNVPRHLVFRLTAGTVAIITIGWTILATNSFTMPMLDTLAFLMSSIAILVTVLERRFIIAPSYKLTN